MFSMGFFKKLVIADSFAIWATNGFDSISSLTFYQAWFISLSYTIQIYFDFSGYSDMAVGIGKIFNIDLRQTSYHHIKQLVYQSFGEDGI